jgi:hypothetical protein
LPIERILEKIARADADQVPVFESASDDAAGDRHRPEREVERRSEEV